jgi:hypothetical protein
MAYTGASYGPTGALQGSNKISGYKQAQLPNFTPQQQQLFQMLLGGAQGGIGGGLDYLGKLAGGDEGAFEQLEAPAYNAFNRTLGQIGTRFSGLGARNSSAFENAVNGAGSDLALQLQSQRQGIQHQSIMDLLGLSENLLGQKPYNNFLAQKEHKQPSTTQSDIFGFLGKIAPSLLALL